MAVSSSAINSNIQRRRRGSSSNQGLSQQPHPHPPSKKARTHRAHNPRHVGLTASTLDVADFAVARTRELARLRSAVRDNDKAAGKRVYQSLAWHARRRSMSHSARRMPKRLRRVHELQLVRSKAVRPGQLTEGVSRVDPIAGRRIMRKYRGRGRFLAAIRRVRLCRDGLLETHVWHAKRFVMHKQHAHVLAARCNDRGDRSALRCAKQACVAHDESYLRVLLVHADDAAALLACLKEVVRADDARRLAMPAVMHGARMARDVVVAAIPAGVASAGPVDVLVSGDGRAAWLWARPDVAAAVLQAVRGAAERAMGKVRVDETSDAPGRFRVLGPTADTVLETALRVRGDAARVLQLGARCVGADVVVNATFRKGDEKTRDRADAAANAAADAAGSNDLWDAGARQGMYERGLRANADAVAGTDVAVPVRLVQRGGSGGWYGWDVIVPRGWCMAVWARLMYINRGRAIGTQELHRVLLVRRDTWLFPEDFVDCAGARKLLATWQTQLEARRRLRPLGKRACLGDNLVAGVAKLCASDVDMKTDADTDADTDTEMEGTLAVVRGAMALRRTLGVMAHVTKGKRAQDCGSGSDNMLVSVRIDAMARGVPKRRAEIRDVVDGAVLGVVLDGAYDLTSGAGVGRGVAQIAALRRTFTQQSVVRAGAVGVEVGGRRVGRVAGLKVVFRNVEAQAPWRHAVLTVVQ